MTKIDLSQKGRLEVAPYVSERKYLRMIDMVSGINMGGFSAERAAVDLAESLATTDASFSLAHAMNIRNLEGWDKAERQWTKIANIETVDDFEPQTFYRLAFDFDTLKHGKGTGGHQVSPVVAEGDTYQYAYGFTEEQIKAAIEKRGWKFGLTLERILSRLRPYVRQLPGDMLNIALDTDEYLVFAALQTAGAASQLATGTAPITGGSVLANSALSLDAIRLGMAQIAARTDSEGNKVKLASSYYLVVASGRGEIAEAELEKARLLRQLQDGSVLYGAPGLGNLGKITGVIESEFIEDDDAWYITPAAGATRKPGLVKLQLSGRTAPEVLVNNFTGSLLRGGNGASPFDLAHFDNDTVDLKLRQFTNSALITQEQLVWSNGSGEE